MPSWFGNSRGGGGGGGRSGGSSGRNFQRQKPRGSRSWWSSHPDNEKTKGTGRQSPKKQSSSRYGKTEKQKLKGQGQKTGQKKAGHLDSRDWAREAVTRMIPDLDASPLLRIQTRVPFLPGSGKSLTIHPLSRDEFWYKFFGLRAFVLRRGANHRVLLTPTESAALIRGARLGLDADLMGPGMWNRDGFRPSYQPEHGLPAVAALARGKPIRLLHMETRAKRIFRKDPLLAGLSRLAPGRGLAASLHWTPPNVRAVWENEVHYEQIVVQVYGVRKWTVCSRGLPPKMKAEAPRKPRRYSSDDTDDKDDSQTNGLTRREGRCETAILRKGDVMYLPSWTWHWSGAGPKASSHLELGVMPLRGADLVMALGGKNYLAEMGHPAMATILPLWRFAKAERAADDCIPYCYDLPWADAPMTAGGFCTLPAVGMALQRLSGSSGRPLPHWHPNNLPPGEGHRPLPRPRQRGLFSPIVEVLQPLGQVFGALAVMLALMCFCASSSGSEQHPSGRPKRSAAVIRQERSMNRKSRVTMQHAARQKKLD